MHAGKSVRQKRGREQLAACARRALVAAAVLLLAAVAGFLMARKSTPAASPDARRLVVDNPLFWGGGFLAMRQFDFSPDGQRIVFAGQKGLSIWDAKTSITRPLPLPTFGTFQKGPSTNQWRVPGGPAALARWAPDSQHFIFQALKVFRGSPGELIRVWTLFLVNADTDEFRQIGPELPDDEHPMDLCWLPDGKR